MNPLFKPTANPLAIFIYKNLFNLSYIVAIILAILMNNDDKLDIGETLRDLKSFSKELDPSLKGECFSNCEKVKTEHNKFAK